MIFWGGQRWFLYDSVRERETRRLKQRLEKGRLKALAREEKEAAAREQELQLDIMEANRLLEGPVEK